MGINKFLFGFPVFFFFCFLLVLKKMKKLNEKIKEKL